MIHCLILVSIFNPKPNFGLVVVNEASKYFPGPKIIFQKIMKKNETWILNRIRQSKIIFFSNKRNLLYIIIRSDLTVGPDIFKRNS